MGKRATKKISIRTTYSIAQKKANKALPKTFPCLLCPYPNSVAVKMNRKAGTGSLSCSECGERFQTGINYLSVPVDVYGDWVDACAEAAAAVAAAEEEREEGEGEMGEEREEEEEGEGEEV